MLHTKKPIKSLISLIVPAYMQQKTIVKDVQKIQHVMEKLKRRYEIIIVIDGQLDQTEKVLRGKKIPHVKIVGYKHNHGKGYAVRYGMAQAEGDMIAFLDAGMDLNPEGVLLFIDYMEDKNADIVIGSKLHPLSKVRYPWQRRFMSWGYRNLVKTLFGLSVSDTQVGIKLFKRSVLEDVLPRLLVKKYAFDIEILTVAHHLGYKKIYEAPIELTFGTWSSITSSNFLQAISRMLWDTFAVFYRLRILRYYDEKSRRKWRYDPELNFRVNVG